MANSTDTYWDINGVSLQTLGFNITTVGDHAPPPLRGDDTTVPYRVGKQLNDRIPDSRTESFKMWAIGMSEDGTVGAFGPRAEYEKNYKKVRDLIWNQGRPFNLTKRWKDYGSGTVKSATAVGVYQGGLAASMTGPARATFGFDVWLADPFYYGGEETVNFLGNGTVTPTILGDYPTTLITLQLNGARTNSRLTNTTEGHYVNIATAIAAGQNVILDVDKWTAKRSVTPFNVIRDITHFGHKHWLSLRPGAQALALSSSSGTGTAVLKYKPRWV